MSMLEFKSGSAHTLQWQPVNTATPLNVQSEDGMRLEVRERTILAAWEALHTHAHLPNTSGEFLESQASSADDTVAGNWAGELRNESRDEMQVELAGLRHNKHEQARPSDRAFSVSYDLIENVAIRLRYLDVPLPIGYVMGDEEGGVRIEWESSDRRSHVRVSVHAYYEPDDYIYYERDGSRGLDRLSAERLAYWLIWFVG
jgi:hypothetical protein